jgi:hypothetical protein
LRSSQTAPYGHSWQVFHWSSPDIARVASARGSYAGFWPTSGGTARMVISYLRSQSPPTKILAAHPPKPFDHSARHTAATLNHPASFGRFLRHIAATLYHLVWVRFAISAHAVILQDHFSSGILIKRGMSAKHPPVRRGSTHATPYPPWCPNSPPKLRVELILESPTRIDAVLHGTGWVLRLIILGGG